MMQSSGAYLVQPALVAQLALCSPCSPAVPILLKLPLLARLLSTMSFLLCTTVLYAASLIFTSCVDCRASVRRCVPERALWQRMCAAGWMPAGE